MKTMKKLKYFSCCSGIGGFELALNQATRHSDWQTECIGYSEIDKFADSVYQKHFKGLKNYGDIFEINPKELPEFDLLCAGFPCQPFSTAGKRGGFLDERGQVFFALAGIIKEKRPKIITLENVPGLLSSDKGRTFATILSTLSELRYGLEWQVLDSSLLGSPQQRKRVILVGMADGFPDFPIFPIESSCQTHFDEARIVTYSKTRDEVKLKDKVNTIIASYRGVGNYNQPGVLTKDDKIRRLSPEECEKLQGFPVGWTEFGKNGEAISATQRYHMCGNAICVPMLKIVFDRILKNSFYTDDIDNN